MGVLTILSAIYAACICTFYFKNSVPLKALIIQISFFWYKNEEFKGPKTNFNYFQGLEIWLLKFKEFQDAYQPLYLAASY